jgi:sugar phosphate isomerase/epimerase
VIDFRPVFKLLDDFGYKGWMVVEANRIQRWLTPSNMPSKRGNTFGKRQESNR